LQSGQLPSQISKRLRYLPFIALHFLPLQQIKEKGPPQMGGPLYYFLGKASVYSFLLLSFSLRAK